MIGEKIKNLRLEKNLTQEKLAAQFFVSSQAISKWEQGLATPDTSLLVPIADFFSVTVDYLLRESDRSTLDIYSLISISINLPFKKISCIGSVTNQSEYTFKNIYFKVKFKDKHGKILDFWHESVDDLAPNDTKSISVFSNEASKVCDYEIEIVDFEIQ